MSLGYMKLDYRIDITHFSFMSHNLSYRRNISYTIYNRLDFKGNKLC